MAVIRCHTAHYDHMFGAGLQVKCCIQGLVWLCYPPNAGKVRVEPRSLRKLLGTPPENNRGIWSKRLVRFGHHFDWGRTDGNDQVWRAISVLAKIPVAKPRLRIFFWKQVSVQILDIELGVVSRLP